MKPALTGFFDLDAKNESVVAYIFARTVPCPRTGKPVPLSPNSWLPKDKGGTAVRIVTERKRATGDGTEPLDECEFDIVSGKAIDFDPDRGTVAGGDGISPWDHLAIDGDHIKAEAQAGRMGSQLYAVAVRVSGKRGFRAPTATDLAAIIAAEKELATRLPAWLAQGMVPVEEIDRTRSMTGSCFTSRRICLRHSAEHSRAQLPDLLVYAPDMSDGYFCEVKGHETS